MPERVRNINLLPEIERERTGLFYLFIVLVVISLLSYVVIGFFYFTTKGKLKDAEEEYAELSEKVDTLKAQVEQIEDEGESLEQAVLFAENNVILTSKLIEELFDSLPLNGYISEYEYSNQEVNLTTHFETLDLVAEYTTNLNYSPYLRDTKVNNIITFDFGSEEDIDLSLIPRYEASFTLDIEARELKGDTEQDE